MFMLAKICSLALQLESLVSRFDLVIFDCDGVLVDSERITNRIYCAMLNDLGLQLSLDDMFEKFVGRASSQNLALITEMLGKAPPKDFFPAYQQRAWQALKEQVTAVPGVQALLDSIEQSVAVASSGEMEKMQVTLGRSGLLPYFEGRIFSVRDVENPKPAPDLYLLAASTLGVAPERCAVIEDTITGVTAGSAAGMHVFGFTDHTAAERLIAAGATETFAHMSELVERLRS